MAVLSILHQRQGPLDFSVHFKSPSDGPAVLMVCGSVWSPKANVPIGIEVSIDQKPIGHSSIYSNLASTHRATVATYIPVQLSIGDHVLFLGPLTGETVSDSNDYYEAVLLY